jgi:putative ABC transport system permease protein
VKYLKYILRNARRNPVRSLLTIASVAISLMLVMILVSFFAINGEVAASSRVYNRIITMSSQGFGGKVPIARATEIAAMDGIVATSPFIWYGGKFNEEVVPFAQFGVNAETFFPIYNEFTIPPAQLRAFKDDKAGCVIGRKLAQDRKFKIGDPLPLKGDIYPFDLTLVIRGIYDGPTNRDLRMCVFHWSYLDEGMKRDFQGRGSGNAGIVVVKCKSGDAMASISRKIDEQYLNSDTPTRTMTEEAFTKMFEDMMGDLKGIMQWIGFAVCFALIFVSGNAMAMALRERTTEIAVLKAIGFGNQLILFLVLAEAMLVAGIGGVIGAFGSKALFDAVDISPYSAGFLPFFFISWTTALLGLVASLLIGFVSGIIPAFIASRRSVVMGLRKVV